MDAGESDAAVRRGGGEHFWLPGAGVCGMARAMSEAVHIDVAKTADLARLRLTPEEAESYRGQLDRILEYISLLGRVDTSGVELMAHPLGLMDSVRADVVVESFPVEAALANAPARVGDQILVPRVVE